MRAIFRCGAADAAFLAPLIGVPAPELTSMPNLNACVHLTGHAPFSVRLAPPEALLERPTYTPPKSLFRQARTTKERVDDARRHERERHAAELARRARMQERRLAAARIVEDDPDSAEE
jgi:hypothetical protein